MVTVAHPCLPRCPAGNALRSEGRQFKNSRTRVTRADTIIYRSSQLDCAGCSMKERCCPKTPVRKVVRSIYEAARDEARRIATTPAYKQSRRERKKAKSGRSTLPSDCRQSRMGADSNFALPCRHPVYRRGRQGWATVTVTQGGYRVTRPIFTASTRRCCRSRLGCPSATCARPARFELEACLGQTTSATGHWHLPRAPPPVMSQRCGIAASRSVRSRDRLASPVWRAPERR
jgi:hypothetical protein